MISRQTPGETHIDLRNGFTSLQSLMRDKEVGR